MDTNEHDEWAALRAAAERDEDSTVTSYELGRAFAACCRGIDADEAFRMSRLPVEYRAEFTRGVESL